MLRREDVIDVVMSVNRALLGCVTPNLREVKAAWNADEVVVACFYDGEISEEISEMMSVAETEVMTDFLDVKPVRFILVRKDWPAKTVDDWPGKADDCGRVVFQRAEKGRYE